MKFKSLKNPRNLSGLFVSLIKYVLLIGLCFIVLYPFIAKLCSSFMSEADTFDPTVKFIARNPTIKNYLFVIFETKFTDALRNTALISLLYSVCTTASCALVGYGLAKFKLKLSGIIMVFIVFTMLVPPQTLMLPIFSYFEYFDPLGIFTLILGHPLKLRETFTPMIFLGLTGFGFRAGLFTLIFRQFFTGVPDQLIEAAYVDGSGVFKTFIRITLPLSKPVLITVFLFSFCWQWTDTFYSSLLFNEIPVLSNTITMLSVAIASITNALSYYASVIVNTGVMLSIFPLIILFCFFQKGFVQGVERSGIVE